jgi:NADH dehydrogenase (ubiquinone) Fe-S protein 5
MDFNECMNNADDPKECKDFRDDYLECLHHRKEFTRLNLFAKAASAEEKHGNDDHSKPGH